MIRVTVDLISAIHPSRSRTVAMMEIANDGETTARDPKRGAYMGVTYRGRDRDALDKRVVSHRGLVADWPREAFHVWNLVARMLAAMGYDKGMAADAGASALPFAAKGALRLLNSYGPDDEHDDDEFVAVRAGLRAALEAESGE